MIKKNDWGLDVRSARCNSAMVILLGQWPTGVGSSSHHGRVPEHSGYPFRVEDLGELLSGLPRARSSNERREGREVCGGGRSQPYLTTSEAAGRLHLTKKTLETWRFERRGPPYRKFGRKVLYHVEELDEWARAQSRSSGASDGPAAA